MMDWIGRRERIDCSGYFSVFVLVDLVFVIVSVSFLLISHVWSRHINTLDYLEHSLYRFLIKSLFLSQIHIVITNRSICRLHASPSPEVSSWLSTNEHLQ